MLKLRSFEENAEQFCNEAVQRAIASDPRNPEAYQTLTSFRLSQQDYEQAMDALSRCVHLFIPSELLESFFTTSSRDAQIELEPLPDYMMRHSIVQVKYK